MLTPLSYSLFFHSILDQGLHQLFLNCYQGDPCVSKFKNNGLLLRVHSRKEQSRKKTWSRVARKNAKGIQKRKNEHKKKERERRKIINKQEQSHVV